MDNIPHKVCPKCKIDRPQQDYVKTHCIFFPGGYAPICISCMQKLIDPLDLAQVDHLMRWLDFPFLVDQWTSLYKQTKADTLRSYLKLVGGTEQYQGLDWQYTNELWEEAMTQNLMIDHIAEANNAWLLKMQRKWPAEIERTTEDYHYLEDLYNDILATQNLITATQRDDAKRLCEIGLLINKKIRAGLDAKKEMDMYHNIIKAEGFEPKNSKNVGEFDSVGRTNLLTLNFSNCWELLVA